MVGILENEVPVWMGVPHAMGPIMREEERKQCPTLGAALNAKAAVAAPSDGNSWGLPEYSGRRGYQEPNQYE